MDQLDQYPCENPILLDDPGLAEFPFLYAVEVGKMGVGPWGDVIADGRDLPGVVHARIDLEAVKSARARIPSLSHDRAYEFEAERKRGVA